MKIERDTNRDSYNEWKEARELIDAIFEKREKRREEWSKRVVTINPDPDLFTIPINP